MGASSGARARLGVRASIVGAQQGTSTQLLSVRVYYIRFNRDVQSGTREIDLLDTQIPVDAEEQSQALTVDIYPCLRDTMRLDLTQVGRVDGPIATAAARLRAAQRTTAPADARCDVAIELALVVNGDTVDHTIAGPRSLTPGSREEIDAPPLFAGLNKPGLEVLSGPTAVEPFGGAGLVRMVVRASDPDRNLTSLQLIHAPEPAFSFLQLPAPIATLTDTLYWFINMSSANLGTARLDAFDTKGQDSTLTLPITGPPQTRPAVSNVSAAIGPTGTTDVSFTVFARGGVPTAAEVLFRDPAFDQSLPVLGGLAGPPCVRPIQAPVNQTTFTVRLTCPTPGQGFAQVIVIPFDQTGPGQAQRGPVAIF